MMVNRFNRELRMALVPQESAVSSTDYCFNFAVLCRRVSGHAEILRIGNELRRTMNLELLKKSVKVYINPQSVEFLALVQRDDPMHSGFMDLVFLNEGAINTVFSIPHQTSGARDESNPELPRYPINCWKDVDEDHKALPADHAAFDHPFEEKKKDVAGQVVQKERPLHEQDIAEHIANLKAQAQANTEVPPQIFAVSPEDKAANDAANLAAQSAPATEPATPQPEDSTEESAEKKPTVQ
jgi:hypothetical protein